MTFYHSVRDGYFDTLYAKDPDPWRFQTSAYERDKYAATLAALGPRRFHSGLEIGCSIGVLTSALGHRCEALLAIDLAEAALAAAKQRCREQPNVSFAHCAVPEAFPAGKFDLIVLSEVLYFLTAAGIDALAARIEPALLPGACVVLVDWLGSTETELGGEAAARRFIAAAASFLAPTQQGGGEGFRLDVLHA